MLSVQRGGCRSGTAADTTTPNTRQAFCRGLLIFQKYFRFGLVLSENEYRLMHVASVKRQTRGTGQWPDDS